MDILSIVIVAFVILETFNVLILYFAPGTRRGNGLGVFDVFEKSKKDPEVYALVRYLANWVAGTKLVFIALLLVIVVMGTDAMKLVSIGALVLSILTFYWRLYPAIRRMDKAGEITPKGYAKTLGIMIAGFVGMFLVAIVLFFAFSSPR